VPLSGLSPREALLFGVTPDEKTKKVRLLRAVENPDE
jgi:hypothetical protein